MNKEDIETNTKPEKINESELRTFEEMKKQLGDKYEEEMYQMNKEFLLHLNELEIRSYDLQSELDIANKKLEQIKEYVLSVIKEHETGQYDVSTVGFAIKEHKGNIENILEILNEGGE